MAPETFTPNASWFREVVPDGLALGETTVISGPGGSGKPLVGLSVVDDWLAAGGSVIVILTNSDRTFIEETLSTLYGTTPQEYESQLAWVDFDPERAPTDDELAAVDTRRWAGNILAPSVWRAGIERASAAVEDTGPGTLIFGVALNLLLFSPTYRDEILDAIVETADTPGDHTVLFTVSTSAFADQIAAVEQAADTVLLADRDDEGLHLSGVRADSVSMTTDPVSIPFTAEELDQVKAIAEANRDELIPTIKTL